MVWYGSVWFCLVGRLKIHNHGSVSQSVNIKGGHRAARAAKNKIQNLVEFVKFGQNYVMNVGRGYVINHKGGHRAARAAKNKNQFSPISRHFSFSPVSRHFSFF